MNFKDFMKFSLHDLKNYESYIRYLESYLDFEEKDESEVILN